MYEYTHTYRFSPLLFLPGRWLLVFRMGDIHKLHELDVPSNEMTKKNEPQNKIKKERWNTARAGCEFRMGKRG